MTRDWLQMELGRRIRRERERQGMSLSDLASRARLSRRFLTEAEAGRANPSIVKLAGIARALRMPLGRLCDLPLAGSEGRRVALIGLRGAGKSTIGRRLALGLERPFFELDRLIVDRSGLALAQIFSLHGETLYHRLEREALEDYLERAGDSVLATGGSLVTQAASFERLLESAFVVWLRASAQDHWNRVIAQGDLRPMSAHPRAKEELAQLLREREALYARAHLVVDTSSNDPERAVAAILAALG
ncbi:MAG: helix-turn-helix domain-containing protein [Planctomycetes bacterium]|nr:helix-turn-helix domain-containing protein [Planctomycetota bacterium]